ncbi:hypothetical protein NCC49_006006 [Naganishia albida]|nr:hypothetical protein NCC49_006006 [Naganishia albida]
MVSRLTGIRMHSTTPVLKMKTPQQDINIERILNGATGGIGIVFDEKAPRYLMQYSANNEGKEYRAKEFYAAQLDIKKLGGKFETKYEVYGFGTGKFNYDTIMDRGEGRQVRLVVPY